MAEKIKKLGVKREAGYLYFIDVDGDVSRAKMAQKGKKGGKAIKVAKAGIKKEAGYLYFLDTKGDISRAKMTEYEEQEELENDELEDEDNDCIEKTIIPLKKEEFFNKKYYQRKLIFLSENKKSAFYNNSMCVLNINDLPNIEFSNGYEIANKLYVGHPYIKEKYMPFEDYELELINDRVREFSEIMQYLGAEKVEIVNIKEKNKNNSLKEKNSISGGIDYKVVKIDASFDNSISNSLEEKIKHGVELCQNFAPTKKPILPLPEYFIWYPHENSWQRIVRQRMNGSLLEHTEKIETMKSKFIEKSEIKSITASLKFVLNGLNGSYLNDIEEKLKNDENVELTIHVKFAPLDSLK